MGQHLEGIESRVEHYLCLRHLPLDSVGKTEEQGIAAGEDDEGSLTPNPSPAERGTFVLFEDGIKRDGDVNPLGIGR